MAKDKPKIEIKYADRVVGSYTLYRSMPKGARVTQWGTFFPGQGEDGYGRKITTDIILIFNGESKRKYRVYATCFSNCASHWITYQGQTLHLGTHFQDEIKPESEIPK